MILQHIVLQSDNMSFFPRHQEINWTRPPPRDAAQFDSRLARMDRTLLGKIVQTLRDDRQVTIIQLTQSSLRGRSLGATTEIIPEMAEAYGRLTSHQMKSIAMVDRGVPYETPWRGRGMRIRKEGRRCSDPHLAFANNDESEKFGIYGSATLAIVIQANLQGSRDKLLRDLERAIHSGRVEKLIILTSHIPFWFDPCDMFDQRYTTVQFHKLN